MLMNLIRHISESSDILFDAKEKADDPTTQAQLFSRTRADGSSSGQLQETCPQS